MGAVERIGCFKPFLRQQSFYLDDLDVSNLKNRLGLLLAMFNFTKLDQV
jgi:hypothetical protein